MWRAAKHAKLFRRGKKSSQLDPQRLLHIMGVVHRWYSHHWYLTLQGDKRQKKYHCLSDPHEASHMATFLLVLVWTLGVWIPRLVKHLLHRSLIYCYEHWNCMFKGTLFSAPHKNFMAAIFVWHWQCHICTAECFFNYRSSQRCSTLNCQDAWWSNSKAPFCRT